jgi:hypothetical protein
MNYDHLQIINNLLIQDNQIYYTVSKYLQNFNSILITTVFSLGL